jgi:glycosyltransferase involved in cell wall biosynthesis
MKIALITDSIRDKITGVGVYSREIINALMKYAPNITYNFIDYKKTSYNQNKLILIDNKILTSKKSIWYNMLPVLLKKHRFDYVINFTGTPHLFPYPQKEIIVIHDIHPIARPEFSTFKTTIYNKLFLKRSLNQAFKILVNSYKTEQELINIFNIPKNKILKLFIPAKITHTTVNTNMTKDQKPYILSINTVSVRKNLNKLIEAFEILKSRSKIPHVLVIIGKLGYGYKKIIPTINSSKYKNDISVKGYVSDSEKFFLLKNAKALIYISEYEGLGIPLYEAAYYKCPIVASKIPAVSEYFKESVIQVDSSNAESISKGIFKTITNTKLRKINISKCYKIAKPLYSKQNVKKQTAKLINFLNLS